MRNTDPLQPWNEYEWRDDPFAPHNDPLRKDNSYEPWNDPAGRVEDLDDNDRRYYRRFVK